MGSFWLFANTALGFHSLKTPIPELTTVAKGHSENLAQPEEFTELPAFSRDITLLRDPFSYHLASDQNPAPSKVSSDASGIHLQGIILSRRNGIALQDAQNGTVYFLSDGEEADGVLVKSITRSQVSVEVNGKTMDFPIAGVKK